MLILACMLDAFSKCESFLNEKTTSYGVMYVTLIKLHSEIGNCGMNYLQAGPVFLTFCLFRT